MKHLKKIFEIEDNEEDDRSIEIFEVDNDMYEQSGNSFQITDDELDGLKAIDLVSYEYNEDTGGGVYYYKENDANTIEEWLEEFRDPINKASKKFGI
jgi:hypothetical protein